MYICKNCEKSFEEKYSKWSDGNFCCKECARSYSQKHSKKTKIRHCVDCGIEVEVDCHISDNYVRCEKCSKEHLKKRKHNNYESRQKKLSQEEHNHCIECGCKIPKRQKYCSQDCCRKHNHKIKMLEVEEKNGIGCEFRQIKTYIIETRGHKCEICGNAEWMGQPIPLILDHINGRASDDRLENLRLVCCNCDAQLPTYKSKNKNSDRRKRKGVWK